MSDHSYIGFSHCLECAKTAYNALLAERDALTAEVAALQLRLTSSDTDIAELRSRLEAVAGFAALKAEVLRLREAIAATRETYDYVAGSRWTGEECCWFCEGEMANQRVNHKDGCVWVESKAALAGGPNERR